MENNKITISLFFTIVCTVLGWGVTFGICQQKISYCEKQIERIEQRQGSTDIILNSINTQLAELNTKVTMMLEDKIK